ncbi:GNAT family N-acetyltransferase [Clostridium estertheticum]|uniref:GNAT family N-acetyltransferase n=1 Tax=Clostridium estertheticum TaxID=238834 RepID=UPI001C7E19C8|nr:GNAT family N-acetyltransferase [Clostridium estertheticum]MBX4267236.1 GNAT family N-acetyltransferase [Clostridium estertheticum]WLC91244.1 GNAT family N-acetyltransferase [Clostridium estertheticum]
MGIRIANINDFETVYRLFNQIFKLHLDRRPDIYTDGVVITENQYEEMIEGPNDTILLWIDDDKVAGLCHMIKKESIGMPMMKDCIQAYIQDFVVDFEYRFKGIGRKLFGAAKQQAKEWNATSLELNVWEVNKEAECFYNKMGLKIKSTRMECKLD